VTRPFRDPNAPHHLCGYAVLAATARPAGTVSLMDGTAPHYAGVARVVHPNGKQAVVWYDEAAWHVSSDGLFASMASSTGVDNVVRWTSAATARRNYGVILAETV
jgi:hypothetical protein